MSILSTGIDIGHRAGFEEGRLKGIQNLIQMGRNLHLDDPVIIEQLCSLYHLDLSLAKKFLQNYSENNIHITDT